MIITIDGPASSGKGTVARLLAKEIDAFHLDSGLLYRALAYYTEERNIDVESFSDEIFDLFKETFHMEYDFCTQRARMVHVERDITDLLRQQSIGKHASLIAQNIAVRDVVTQKIRALQRRFCSIVADGRDMGSVVFPDADFHFYLDASISIRSQRRYEELVAKGVHVTLEEIEKEIAARDLQDRSRAVAPLVCTAQSIVIETDHQTAEEVLQKILNSIQKK